MRLVALGAGLVLACSWVAGYLRRSAPLATDVLDALALMTFALAAPVPSSVLATLFAAIWYRCLYGTTSGALVRCALYATGFIATIPLAPYVPGGSAVPSGPAVVGAVPTMFLTVLVGRFLAGMVRARQQDAQRDAVHMALGSQLLGVADAAEIHRIAWRATVGICAATPGLRVLGVVRDATGLRVSGAAGGFAGVLASLTCSVPLADSTLDPAADPAVRTQLDDAVGAPCAWTGVPLPDVPDEPARWLLIGHHKVVPVEAVVSLRSLSNQLSLALRNSEVQHELTVQATVDGLTGLANRGSFTAALTQALAQGPQLLTSVLFVDLDDFKDVNDVMGHAAGDELLREMALRLRRAARPQDLCARLGGDEFAVLLRGAGTEIATEVAQRIVRSVAAPTKLAGGVATVGASVGVATATDGMEVEALVHSADVAMYSAKASGKGRTVVFAPGLMQNRASQLTFEQELATAAANGQLVVEYQPIMSLPQVRCTAVEALARWQHPERGLLHPADFVEVAERTGAIQELGAHVLRRACADSVVWRRTHPQNPLKVHVNVSAVQLDEAFLQLVQECLLEHSMAADQLVLEVTESLVVSSPTAIARLDELAAAGVGIAVEDFGTGYSALTTLRSLPVGIVKIDPSFVAGALMNPHDRAVTEAIVQMAARLGLQTVADGVERLSQQEFLQSVGVDAVQGFLYLRPTGAAELGDWLDAHIRGLAPPATPSGDTVVPFAPRGAAGSRRGA